MALEKLQSVHLEISNDGCISVKETTQVLEDGVLIGESEPLRYVETPAISTDVDKFEKNKLEGAIQRIKVVADAIWDDKCVDNYKKKLKDVEDKVKKREKEINERMKKDGESKE